MYLWDSQKKKRRVLRFFNYITPIAFSLSARYPCQQWPHPREQSLFRLPSSASRGFDRVWSDARAPFAGFLRVARAFQFRARSIKNRRSRSRNRNVRGVFTRVHSKSLCAPLGISDRPLKADLCRCYSSSSISYSYSFLYFYLIL